jgi:hypothetical protein
MTSIAQVLERLLDMLELGLNRWRERKAVLSKRKTE